MSERLDAIKKIKVEILNILRKFTYLVRMRQYFRQILHKVAKRFKGGAENNKLDEKRREFLLGSTGSVLLITSKSDIGGVLQSRASLVPLSEKQMALLQYLTEANAEIGSDGLFILLQNLTEKGKYNLWNQIAKVKQKLKQGAQTCDKKDLVRTILQDLYGDIFDSMRLAFRFADADLSVLSQIKENAAFRELVRHIFDGVELSDEQILQISQFRSLANLNENYLRQEITELLELLIETFRDLEPISSEEKELQSFLFENLDFICNSDEAQDYRDWLRINGKRKVLNKMREFVLKVKIKQEINATQDELEKLIEKDGKAIKINSNTILTNHYSSARNFVRLSFGKGVKRFALHALGSSEARSIENKKYTEFGKEFSEVQKESTSGFVKVVVYYS